VWGVSLTVDDGEIPEIEAWLSCEERERASRLISEGRQQQFVAAHAAVRLILSRYCQCRPQDLAFHKTSRGKPFLSGTGRESLHFNLTHSQGRALIAVTRGRDIGVDLERVRPEADVMRLANRFFSSRDQEYIASAEPPARPERFLHVWVAKEAVSKAGGSGITFPLNREHVEIEPDAIEGRLIGADPHMTPMVFRFLPLEKDWVGAVAAKETGWRLVLCG
jgi:4'-phosphopantetheinyl transferase